MVQWRIAELADAVEAGLRTRASADDAEQAVYGFDTLDELGLHPLIQQALRAAGYGVWPEQRYPDDWQRIKRSEGKRCDIVLTPDRLPFRDPQLRNTIFDVMEAVDAGQAYWLEIKTVAQFEKEGAFRRYCAELLKPVAEDVRKLWEDVIIRHGGLLLVLFTAGQEVAEHDLVAWHERCIQRGLPVGAPAVRGFEIADRVGNNWCATALFPVRGG